MVGFQSIRQLAKEIIKISSEKIKWQHLEGLTQRGKSTKSDEPRKKLHLQVLGMGVFRSIRNGKTSCSAEEWNAFCASCTEIQQILKLVLSHKQAAASDDRNYVCGSSWTAF